MSSHIKTNVRILGIVTLAGLAVATICGYTVKALGNYALDVHPTPPNPTLQRAETLLAEPFERVNHFIAAQKEIAQVRLELNTCAYQLDNWASLYFARGENLLQYNR